MSKLTFGQDCNVLTCIWNLKGCCRKRNLTFEECRRYYLKGSRNERSSYRNNRQRCCFDKWGTNKNPPL